MAQTHILPNLMIPLVNDSNSMHDAALNRSERLKRRATLMLLCSAVVAFFIPLMPYQELYTAPQPKLHWGMHLPVNGADKVNEKAQTSGLYSRLRPLSTPTQAMHPGPVHSSAHRPANTLWSRFVVGLATSPVFFSGLFCLWRRRLQPRDALSVPQKDSLQLYTEDDAIFVDKGSDPADTSMDTEMERSRSMHRTVYDHEAWREHRNSARIFRAAWGLVGSRIMARISFEVAIISLLSGLICVLQTSSFGKHWLSLPSSIFSLSAPSLGLLLVFRTNASYGRWDETRRAFGSAITRCQDLARKALSGMSDQPELQQLFLRYLQAFPYALKVHVRSGAGGCENDDNLMEDLQEILRPDELQLLFTSTHRPLYILQCLTEILKASHLNLATAIAMDHSLSSLADITGACDRLLRTPIPLSYTSLTTRFLVLWLTLLPLALSADILRGGHAIWLTIPAVAFISFLLLGIEEVGVQIEEPFTILPLEVIARNGRNTILALMALHQHTYALVKSKASAA